MKKTLLTLVFSLSCLSVFATSSDDFDGVYTGTTRNYAPCLVVIWDDPSIGTEGITKGAKRISVGFLNRKKALGKSTEDIYKDPTLWLRKYVWVMKPTWLEEERTPIVIKDISLRFKMAKAVLYFDEEDRSLNGVAIGYTFFPKRDRAPRSACLDLEKLDIDLEDLEKLEK